MGLSPSGGVPVLGPFRDSLSVQHGPQTVWFNECRTYVAHTEANLAPTWRQNGVKMISKIIPKDDFFVDGLGFQNGSRNNPQMDEESIQNAAIL